MIQLGENIRMTVSERQTLSQLVGFDAKPQTCKEHADLVARAKAGHDQVVEHVAPELDEEGSDNSGFAEARLMSAVLGAMLSQT